MPAKYEKLGVSFQYPENWTLDEADALEGRESVTVYSPGGAFWSVSVHRGHADPAALSRGVVEVMREVYDELDAAEVHETVAGRELIGYDLNFYCLDFTNSAQVRSVRVGRTTYTIFCQAEDREFARVERVFNAITLSLLAALRSGGMNDEGGRTKAEG